MNSIRTGSLCIFAVATIILYELAKAPGRPRSTSSSSSGCGGLKTATFVVHLDCCATDHEVHDNAMVGDPHDLVGSAALLIQAVGGGESFFGTE